MPALTCVRDLDHPMHPEVELTIREPILSCQGVQGVLFVQIKFRLVQPGIDPHVLSQCTPAVRRALWAIGERRSPHLRYDVHEEQRLLGQAGGSASLHQHVLLRSVPRLADMAEALLVSEQRCPDDAMGLTRI